MKKFAQFLSEATKPESISSSKKQKVESKGILTVAFGRFNPPTKGHKKFLDGVAKVAGDGVYKIYPSRTIDKNKNPLDPDTKISLMRKMYPDHGERIVNDDDFKSIFDVLTKAYEDGYEAINIVVGADRQAEIEKLATKYNKDLYDFSELNIVSVGKQDPDSDKEINLSSAKLRKAVAEKDYKTFRKGIPNTLSDEEIENLFMMLADSMKIKEGCTLWKICPESDPKNLRESYIQNKIFRIGEWVENLNTGLIGKIIRRGANYLICVTEDDVMFKPWIKDVKEWTKVSGVSAKQREVGTDSLRKYTMKMTGTKKIMNFNIQDFINKNRKK